MKIHFTFDTDWCPDYMIEDVLNELKKLNIKATFFITNKSDIIDELIKQKHSIGIHPNLVMDKNIKQSLKKIEKLIDIIPNAKFIRTHALHMNTYLLINIFKEFKNIQYDFSTLTYKSKNIELCEFIFDKIKIRRVNYNWEDSIAIHDKNFNWGIAKFFSKKNIYNFHPIHTFFNTPSYKFYVKLKKELKINKNFLNEKKFKYKKQGVKNFFDTILKKSDYQNNILNLL